MATTLQSIIGSIRAAQIVPAASVNYGITDGLQPPYIEVSDFHSEPEYDTSGVVTKTSTFKVTVIERGSDAAENLAVLVDAVLNLSATLTPHTLRCFQQSWDVGQLAEQRYQFGVVISYQLQEGF